MKRFTTLEGVKKLQSAKDLRLPDFSESLESVLSSGELFQVDGTNVIRVPFGIRQPIKQRPQRPDRGVTLVIPFQPLGSPTPPPQAA
tara:strand:- start:1800 stop:2060 length:261 start_codon:yes stop_codon:yes gene_type:complete